MDGEIQHAFRESDCNAEKRKCPLLGEEEDTKKNFDKMIMVQIITGIQKVHNRRILKNEENRTVRTKY